MPDDKRTRIINAAIQVFARKGLERGKIADIARVAGIGKGTVYEYFRSKEELFQAIEETVLEEMSAALSTIAAAPLAPREKLRAILDESIDQIVQMGDALLIITELWAQTARGHWHDYRNSNLVAMYDDYRDLIVQVLQEGIVRGEFREMNKDGVATLLMAFVDGLAWQYVLLKDQQRFQTIKQEAILSFLRGIEVVNSSAGG
jgi:TetR/AcrR family fatty acid metabolism transcriptional regulator